MDNLTGYSFNRSMSRIKYIRIIWDEVDLSLMSNIFHRYPVNKTVKISIRAEYSYEHTPFIGILIINNSRVDNGEKGIYRINLTKASPRKYTYTILQLYVEKALL